MRTVLFATLPMIAMCSTPVHGGGLPPMFVIVDKVVLEPSESNPERIQIHGWFTRLQSERTDDFSKPVYGYIYLGEGCATDAAKWQKAAGSRKAVVVGGCHKAGDFLTVRIRKLTEVADQPDVAYPQEQLERYGDLYGRGDFDKRPEVKALLAAANVKEVDVNIMMKFITESIMEGLKEDGVPREFAAVLAKNADYFGKCLLCSPTQDAFRQYSQIAKQPEGKGLKEDLRVRLTSTDVPTRHQGLRELVQIYMGRGYAKAKLPDDERKAMQQLIEHHRKAGAAGLANGQKFCPSCEGASCSLLR